jgi:dimethylglycine dehydrogenase
MNMQRYSAAMYRTLGEAVDYPMNYHVTGSIRLAHSRERMMEFERVAGMGRYQGLQMDVCTPAELKEKHPFMETHDLAGGLWDPLDGDIDPAQLTQAMAKGARDAGGRIERFAPVTGIDRQGDEWIVKTPKGEIRCEIVVNCAGYYAQRLGEMFKPFGGRTVPMVTMSHQYFLTEEIPELAEWTKENGRKVPLLRDVDVSYYLRQDKNGLNLGPYERNCKAHWVTPEDPMPEDFSFQLYPDDLERIEYQIEDAMERVPALGTAGINRNINGPIPYAPDGLPMLGPMPGVRNAFEGHCFTFGIAQGGGAGKVLSEWIMHGETEHDMWAVDPRRYTDYTDHDHCLAKALETYGHEYAMHFPHHSWPAGRDKKLSSLQSRLQDAGAVFGAYNGWERANYFARPGDDTSEEATQTWDRNGPWEARIKEECEAVRDGCGVLPITGFSRLSIEGEGARVA